MRLFQLLSLLSLAYLAIAASSSTSSFVKRNGTDSADVVRFVIDLTWEDYDAIGSTPRKTILTNGTIPGPPLNVKQGQTVEFVVLNNLPFETSVHFHGIGQLNTPWSDGAAGLSQWPIPAGGSYLYKWKAEDAGTYFYHAHDKGQMMDGLYGAIIIQADDQTGRPFNLISSNQADVEQMLEAESKNEPVFISDWSQYTFDEFYNIQKAANIDNACADSIIVNGKGSVYCKSRTEIDAATPSQLKSLLKSVNPAQLTNKGCLPPNLSATQGNFAFNLAALPGAAYTTCTPSTGKTSTITVDKAGGWAAMTFINPGGFSTLKFTIDSHKMWVYAVSGAYVRPQYVDQVVVNNGDRYSVLVKLDQPVATYKINVANNGFNQLISGYGALEYKGSSGPASNPSSFMNYFGANTTALKVFNDALAAPFKSEAPSAIADLTYTFDIKKLGQPFGAYEWTLSGSHGYNMSNDDASPLLLQDINKITDSDLILKSPYGKWVDLIVKVQGPLAQPHPMHKHSNKAYVLGSGTGTFNYSSVAEAAAAMPSGTFNFETPPYRDTYTTIPAEGNSSWLALRYKADHPGVWAFHCHMQTHFSGGMAVVLVDGADQMPAIPPEYQDGNGFPQNSTEYTSVSGVSSLVQPFASYDNGTLDGDPNDGTNCTSDGGYSGYNGTYDGDPNTCTNGTYDGGPSVGDNSTYGGGPYTGDNSTYGGGSYPGDNSTYGGDNSTWGGGDNSTWGGGDNSTWGGGSDSNCTNATYSIAPLQPTSPVTPWTGTGSIVSFSSFAIFAASAAALLGLGL